MLMPAKVKYRKQQRGRMRGKAWRGGDVSFGDFGLKALEPCWLTDRQIESARVAMTRFIKRGGKIWVRVFPDKPITKKPQETRMGKGKGAPEEWVCVVRPGRVLFEMEGVKLEEHYRKTLRELGKKSGMLGLIFRKAQNKIQDPAKLRRLIVDLIDKEQWSSLSADQNGRAAPSVPSRARGVGVSSGRTQSVVRPAASAAANATATAAIARFRHMAFSAEPYPASRQTGLPAETRPRAAL
mgnify:CR=1 FL=1